MTHALKRRDLLAATATGAGAVLAVHLATRAQPAPAAQAATPTTAPRKPNLLLVFADQWRAQATGYAGDPNAKTPHLDRLARQSVNFTNAVSCCPVCSPYRACLMTGRYPLTHGVFMNDVCLSTEAVSLAQAFNAAGYDTGYIGKWHLDGHGRSAFIPRERRQGFAFWKALECTHNYNASAYYADEPERLQWEGYDAIAQTREAQRYLREHAGGRPFALVLSWGPPHEPYQTAPEVYRPGVRPEEIVLRPNVPEASAAAARTDLAGYYAHSAALDDCVGELAKTLQETGLERDTVMVFTSDHGDMLHSHGQTKKQRPWDESACVPLLVRYPAALGADGRTVDVPINSPDLMPTVLGLCGVQVPKTVEGIDWSGLLRGTEKRDEAGALLMCPQPFGQWLRAAGGKEWRGVRTRTHTYVRDLDGPWLLYDNAADPHQLKNRVNDPACAAVQKELDALLAQKLGQTRDEFLPGPRYLEKWGYQVNASGTVPYAP
jgi:arylsulfatase A-like enzyme